MIQGRFTIAAKHHISIAEIFETELVDVDKVGLTTVKDSFRKICVVYW